MKYLITGGLQLLDISTCVQPVLAYVMNSHP